MQTAGGRSSDDGETTNCQRALMATCRVARGVVLEHWRRQVEEIDVEDTKGKGGEMWRGEAVRGEVLEVLRGLIDAL